MLRRLIKELKKVWICFLLTFFSGVLIAQQLAVSGLKCEYQRTPLGIEETSPRLSWQLQSKSRNVTQTAYHVLVSDDRALIEKNMGNIWDSRKQSSAQSIQVEYRGKPLEATKVYYWKVKVWDNQSQSSSWSDVASWQMGLLQKDDWKGAQWIAYERLADSLRIVPGVHGNGDPAWGPGKNILPLLRKEFEVKKSIRRATVFIAGLGHFDLRINGEKVGGHFLDAGWTQYNKEAIYVTFDITARLEKGTNALGAMLGNGFYYIPRERYRKITMAYGYPKMICRVLIEYADGSQENIVSDPSWKAHPGPITFSSIYGGEDYDANLKEAGWDQPFFNASHWKNAILVDGPPQLKSQTAAPLIIADSFTVKKITQPEPGVWVYDFGQNASGIFRVKVKGKKNSRVTFKPAELITDDGLITQEASGAPVYFNYTLSGDDSEVWQPQFTYYGFRYIQIEGAVPKGEPNPNDLPEVLEIKSLHTRNGAAKTGYFSCSNDLFNRTNVLINWAIKSNMASVFTDCPHREKLGWLEESHLMGASVNYNYDIATLCRKVIRDMINAQTDEGLIPDIAPEYVHFEKGFRDSPEWGSAGIILPWYVYLWYNDKRVLSEAYPMMKRYAGYLLAKSENYILSHGLGDWFDIGPKNPGESQLTPKGITATAIFYYDLRILSRIAEVLNEQKDRAYFEEIAQRVKNAFNAAFFNKETAQYATGSQTANAMAVYMELTEPEYKDAVVDNLVKDIRERGNSLTAGDIGYHYVLRVLEDNGRSDVIYDMNSRTDVPGYGFQLAHGATALTESWQAYRFVSNNHFMLGHLMEWFYSGLGGIRQAEGSMAFKKIVIHPEPVGDVTEAETKYESPYGTITTKWSKQAKNFNLSIEIPTNTTAVVYLPTSNISQISEGGKTVTNRKEIKFVRYENGRALFSVGSGQYQFQVKSGKENE